jgi:hypothetical protein
MRAVSGLLLGGCLAVAALLGPAARGDDKPMTPVKGYELRIVNVGDSYHGVRFKPATGESWQILGGRWKKLEDAAAPPAGDYDIVVVPTESFLAIRIDRATGTTWLSKGGRWVEVKEPAPPKPGAPAVKRGPGFAVRHVRLGKELHIVRFHGKTGEAWHVNRDAFETLGETGAVPPGEFDVKLIAGEDNWMGFRLDRKTGMTWLLQANKWHLAKEPD